MTEILFEHKNYRVTKNEAPVGELGNGKFSNYEVTNTNLDVVELHASTFVQAATACVELAAAEQSLLDYLHDEEQGGDVTH